MPHKALSDLVWEKAAGEGTLRATFSRFNVVDHDGDLTLATAFTDGQAVPMVWSHDWQRPVGKGRIEVKADRAVFAGRFNLATSWGRDAYESVKDMADLQEYSYGYAPIDAEPGVVDGQSVRILKALKVFEVSPVLVGAGKDTGTESIKHAEPGEPFALEEKPLPAEHSCRLADPGRYDRFRRANDDRRHDGKRIDVIYGHPKSGGGWEQQSLRLPTSDWDAGAARSYCASHDGAFEAASKADPTESFVAHGDRVLAAVRDHHQRAAEIAALRARDGRTLSPATRTKVSDLLEALAAVRGDYEALLTSPVPPPGASDLDALFEQFRRLSARTGGR